MAQRKATAHMFSAREFREVRAAFDLFSRTILTYQCRYLQNIMLVFHRHGKTLVNIIGNLADAGKPFDLHDLFHRFTLVRICIKAEGFRFYP